MCVALPMRIAEVVDPAARTVRLAPVGALAPDRARDEVVSAVLVADDEAALAALVGGFGIAHAGFLLSLLDEEEARSRLAMFEAMDGGALPVAP